MPITLTHLLGFAASRALSNQNDLNGVICFGNVNKSLNSYLVLFS